MKLICISIKTPGEFHNEWKFLTLRKVYEIFPVRNIDPKDDVSLQYCIIDDSGEPAWYGKQNFKWIDEHRAEQIEKLLT